MIGLANAIGSLAAGWLSSRMSKRWLLAWIYLASGRDHGFHPPSGIPATAIAFGISIGLLWLSTVPDVVLIMLMFGTRYMAMLFGFAFFSHQVGGFLGGVARGRALRKLRQRRRGGLPWRSASPRRRSTCRSRSVRRAPARSPPNNATASARHRKRLSFAPCRATTISNGRAA